MKKYDIFICYRGESGISCELGSRIYSEISSYSVFFAPKCINKGDNFKNKVQEVMKDVSPSEGILKVRYKLPVSTYLRVSSMGIGDFCLFLADAGRGGVL